MVDVNESHHGKNTKSVKKPLRIMIVKKKETIGNRYLTLNLFFVVVVVFPETRNVRCHRTASLRAIFSVQNVASPFWSSTIKPINKWKNLKVLKGPKKIQFSLAVNNS